MLKRFEHLIQEGSEEYALAQKVNEARMPAHLAVIMDGNGRWAKAHGLKRRDGHKQGAVTAKKVIEYSLLSGIKHLTLFAFSSENWKRPPLEIKTLMNMLYEQLVNEKELLIKNKIKLNVFGDVSKLPPKLKKKLHETMEMSGSHRAMQLNLALNYGARMEIIQAVKAIVEAGIPAGKVKESLFEKYLYTAGCPDPDLMVRTSGEIRISNFLLYQIAYSELHFTPVHWPDFGLKEFLTAILDYQSRERRFGKV